MLLTELPREIIEEILTYCHPTEVALVSRTCSALYSLVYHAQDSAIWRELYLAQPLDDPRRTVSPQGCPKPHPIDWKAELQRIMHAANIVCSEKPIADLRPGVLREVLDTLLEVACYVPARHEKEEFDEVSSNLLWIAAMLRGTFVDRVEQADDLVVSVDERQRAAQLHTYYGVTHADARAASLVKSRVYLYHMRNYRPDTQYGPFLEGGMVNWVHMQAIHHVMSTHIVTVKEDENFDFVLYPMSIPYTQITLPEDGADERDWAGIAGSWAVSFCFCDHRDLLLFNEASVNSINASLFEDPHFREVFRSLDAEIHVIRTEPDPAHPLHPIIHFYGQMHDPSSSTMTGHVNLTTDNQIQWHFISGEAGSTIWSSAGVQVGGMRSSYGVLGTWTTIFHEDDDPIGPFWLCKRTNAHSIR